MFTDIDVQDLKKGQIQVMAVKLSPSFFNLKHTFYVMCCILFYYYLLLSLHNKTEALDAPKEVHSPPRPC